MKKQRRLWEFKVWYKLNPLAVSPGRDSRGALYASKTFGNKKSVHAEEVAFIMQHPNAHREFIWHVRKQPKKK